jgi:excisionase family DNA binding protein
MLRRPATTPADPYEALADAFTVMGRTLAEALRAVVEDAKSDVVDRILTAQRSFGEDDGIVTVSVAEAAERLGISLSKMKQLATSGEVRSIKVGDRRLIPVSALEALANQGDSNPELGRTLVAHRPRSLKST